VGDHIQDRRQVLATEGDEEEVVVTWIAKPRPLEVQQGGQLTVGREPVVPVAVRVHGHVRACFQWCALRNREQPVDDCAVDDLVAIGGDEPLDLAEQPTLTGKPAVVERLPQYLGHVIWGSPVMEQVEPLHRLRGERAGGVRIDTG